MVIKYILKGKTDHGKTTLLNTILGKITPKSGEVFIGKEVKIGEISQEMLNKDNENQTLYEYITKDMKFLENELEIKGRIFTILDKFNIPYSKKDTKYMNLSPGERSKASLAKMILAEVNTLFLDEVTNHLDIESIEEVTDAIKDFTGTVIFVSHNRDFVSKMDPNIEIKLDTQELKKAENIDKNTKEKKNKKIEEREF